MTASLRSRVGISLGLGLGTVALSILAIPWIPATREALAITGVWVDPSPYYLGSLIAAAAGMIATAALVRRGELRAWKIVVLSLGAFGALSALASLALAAMISIGMAS